LVWLSYFALFGSTAYAGPQAVPRVIKPGFTWRAAKDFLAGRSNFLSGRCLGAVEVLDEVGSDNNLFCPPETTNRLERMRVIVTYIEALPKRMTEGFWRMKRWQKHGHAKLEVLSSGF
jgi:hypothetical protein